MSEKMFYNRQDSLEVQRNNTLDRMIRIGAFAKEEAQRREQANLSKDVYMPKENYDLDFAGQNLMAEEVVYRGQPESRSHLMGQEDYGKAKSYDDNYQKFYQNMDKISYHEVLLEEFFKVKLEEEYKKHATSEGYDSTKKRFSKYPQERLQVMNKAWEMRPKANQNIDPFTGNYVPYDEHYQEIDWRDDMDYSRTSKEFSGASDLRKVQIDEQWQRMERDTDLKNRRVLDEMSTKKVVGINMDVGGQKYTAYYSIIFEPPLSANSLPIVRIEYVYSTQMESREIPEFTPLSNVYVDIEKYVYADFKSPWMKGFGQAYKYKFDASFPEVEDGNPSRPKQYNYFKSEEGKEQGKQIAQYLSYLYHKLKYSWKKKYKTPEEIENLGKHDRPDDRIELLETYEIDGVKFLIDFIVAETNYAKGDSSGAKPLTIVRMHIMYLGEGEDAVKLDPDQTYASAKTEFNKKAKTGIYPHITWKTDKSGLDQVEIGIAEGIVWEMVNKKALDKHYDMTVSIPEGDETREFLYSFNVGTKNLDASISDHVGRNTVEVEIERIGELGKDGIDPKKIDIRDAWGYTESAYNGEEENVEGLKTWIKSRYQDIGTIEGDTVAKITDWMNKKIEDNIQDPTWLENNYKVTIYSVMAALQDVMVEDFNFYVENHPKLTDKAKADKRAKIKEKKPAQKATLTEEAKPAEPGYEVPHSETGADVAFITDETENIKPWDKEELIYLELSFEKMSTPLLQYLQGVGFYRQDYYMGFQYYNSIAGVTHHGSTKNPLIGIFDGTFRHGGFYGSSEDITHKFAGVISHEVAHVVQHQSDPKLPLSIRKHFGGLFNEFVEKYGIQAPTEYGKGEVGGPSVSKTGEKIDESDSEAVSSSEFFPEVMKLYQLDPQYMRRNLPRLFLWFEYLSENGIAPTLSQIEAIIKEKLDTYGNWKTE